MSNSPFKIFTRWEVKEIEEAAPVELVPDGKDNSLIIGESVAVVDEKKVNMSLVKSTAVHQAIFGIILSVVVAVTTGALIALISTGVGYHPPSLKPDHVSVLKNVETVLFPLRNDVDSRGGNLTLVSIQQPHHGIARILDQGKVAYTPVKGYSGFDSFNYTATNDKASATSSIQVTVLNRNPSCTDIHVEILKNSKNVSLDLFAFNDGFNFAISDPDDDEMILVEEPFVVAGSTEKGSLTLSNNSLLLYYTPEPNFVGWEVRNFTVTDGYDLASALLTIHVVNTPPVAHPSVFEVRKYVASQLDILADDVDDNMDELFIDEVYGVGKGGLIVSNDRKLVRYEPYLTAETYSDSFEYTCTDQTNVSSSYFIIYVKNQPPTTHNITLRVSKNSQGVLIPLDYHDDDKLDEPRITMDTASILGSYSLLSTAYTQTELFLDRAFVELTLYNYTVSYVPYSEALGPEVLRFTVSDVDDRTDGFIFLSIENDAPVAVDDTVIVEKNIAKSFKPTDNDYDINDDIFDIVEFSQFETTNKGVVRWINNSTISYSPARGFLGNDTFMYTISDRQQLPKDVKTTSATVTVVVQNTPPVAVKDTYTIKKGFTADLTVMANDYDPNNDTIRLINCTVPVTGVQATIISDGIRYYAPRAVTNDLFSYTISDVDNALATGSVVISVVNTVPVVVNDTYSVSWNRAATLSVLDNDIDEDPGDWDLLQITSVSDPSNGVVSIINGRTIQYTPKTNFTGSDQFSYRIFDGIAYSDLVGSVTLTVLNFPPVTKPKNVTVHWRSASFDLDVLADTTDPEQDVVTISRILSDPQHGILSIVRLGRDQFLHYTASSGYLGPDSFVYQVTDGEKYTPGTVDVLIINRKPTPVVSTISTHWRSSSPVSINVIPSAYDLDGDLIQVNSSSTPGNFNGTLALVGSSFQFTPSGSWKGTQYFTYSLSDGIEIVSANITIIVRNPNVPAAFSTFKKIHWSRQATGTRFELSSTLTPVDADSDSISYRVYSSGFGTAVIDTSMNKIEVVYTQPIGFLGNDTFVVQMCDGLDCALMTYTVNVYNQNPTAKAVNRGYNWKSVGVAGAVLRAVTEAGTSDPDSEDSVIAIALRNVPAVGGNATLSSDGYITFIPTRGFVGSFVFDVVFTDGLANTSATFSLTVNNNYPQLNAIITPPQMHWSYSNGGYVIDTSSMMYDLDGDTLSISGVVSGNVSVESNLKVRYKQVPNFLGSANFVLNITDGWSSVNLQFPVIVYNHPPVVPSVMFNIPWATYKTGRALNVLVNASDSDPQDTVFLSQIVVPPSNGNASIIAPNQLFYTPKKNFVGQDFVRCAVTDGISTVLQNITITMTNNAPKAVADVYRNLHWRNGPYSFNVLANDTDADFDVLSLYDITQPSSGKAQILSAASGLIQYNVSGATPFIGLVTFSYRITDEVSTSSPASVTLDITNNNIPVAVNSSIVKHWRQLMTEEPLFKLYNSQYDSDGDLIALDFIQPSHGIATRVSDGSGVEQIKYSVSNFVGSDSFKYTLSDGATTAQGTVSITSFNNLPTGKNFSLSLHWVEIETGVSVNVLRSAADIDSFDQSSIAIFMGSKITPGFKGTVFLEDADSIYYKPINATGTEVFSYMVTDGVSNSTYFITMTVPDLAQDPYFLYTAILWKDALAGKSISIDVDTALIPYGTLQVKSILTAPQYGNVTIGVDKKSIFYKQTKLSLERDYLTMNVTSGNSWQVVRLVLLVYNTPPTAADLTLNRSHRALLNGIDIQLISNTTDIDGDHLRITNATTTSPSVTLSIVNDTTVHFSIVPKVIGTFYFLYTVSDGVEEVKALVTMRVTNQVPVVQRKSYSFHWREVMAPNGKVLDQVLDYFIDPDGDLVQITSVTASNPQVISSAVLVNSTAFRIVAPSTGYATGYSFVSLSVTDGITAISPSVDITVQNTAPYSKNSFEDLYQVHFSLSNVSLPVLSNFTDNDALDLNKLWIVSAATQTVNAVLNNNGTMLRYTPPRLFRGTSPFTYTISDGLDSTPARASVFVYNNPPVPQTYTKTMHWTELKQMGGVVSLNVSKDTYDADPEDQNQIYVSYCRNDLSFCSISSDLKKMLITPSNGFVGTTIVTFGVTDTGDEQTSTATVTILNNPPYLDSSVRLEVHWRYPVTLNMSNVLKDDDVSSNVTLVTVARTSSTIGNFTIQNNQLVYSPDKIVVGNSDIARLTFTDGWTQVTSDIRVYVVNNKPTVSSVTVNLHQGQIINIPIVASYANDLDAQDKPNLVLENRAFAANILEYVRFTSDMKNITLKHRSVVTSTNPQVLDFWVTDGQSSVQGSLTVNLQNSIPVVPAIVLSIPWTSYVSGVPINLLASATDADNDRLNVTSITNPTHGTVTYQASNIYGNLIIYKPGMYDLTAVSFTIVATDGAATVSSSVSITIVNHKPVANNDYVAKHWKTSSFVVYPLSNDTDADNDPLFIDTFSASGLTVTKTSDNKNLTVSKVVTASDLDVPLAIQYSAIDFPGSSSAATIQVTYYDNRPTMSPNSISSGSLVWRVSSFKNFTVGCQDVDTADKPTLLLLYSSQQYDLTSLKNVPMSAGTLIVNGNAISYVASNTQSYPPCTTQCLVADTFSFKCTDGLLDSALSSVTINVTNNRPQIQKANPLTITKQRQAASNVFYVDVMDSPYVDADGNALTITAVNVITSIPSGQQLVVSTDTAKQRIQVTTSANYKTDATFTYQLTDGQLNSITGTVLLQFINSPPSCGPIDIHVFKGQPASIYLPNYCTDDNGDSLVFSSKTTPSGIMELPSHDDILPSF